MKTLVCSMTLLLAAQAFATPLPSEVLDRLENQVIPAARQGSLQIQKLPRTNSDGRQIPKGLCVFSDGSVSVEVSYCDMAAPQAARIEAEFFDEQEKHSFYVERNSVSQLPRFSIMATTFEGTCILSYSRPSCADSRWLAATEELMILNAPSEGSPQMVRTQMALATRIERISKALRDIAKARP